jgi:hypothetical protein
MPSVRTTRLVAHTFSCTPVCVATDGLVDAGFVRSSLVSLMQSPDPGLVVAERETERAQRARFLGVELWSEAGPPGGEELRRFVADGLEKGFLTYDEIAAALEGVA